MGAEPIALPSPEINLPLSTVEFGAEKLIRISRYKTGEPHFGCEGINRFDDPHRRFGTCYFGSTLSVAIAETLLHERIANNGKFDIAADVLENHYVVRLDGAALRLADLTGAPLKRLNGHGDLSATANYGITQQWSSFIHRHPDKVDGFVYMSRHFNTGKAVVVFGRAAEKIRFRNATSLLKYRGFAIAGPRLGIRAI